MDADSRMALYITTITCAGIVGAMYSSTFSVPFRVTLSIALGLLGCGSLFDLRRQIAGKSQLTANIANTTRNLTRSESERIADLLVRLRSIRNKIGEGTYKRLEEEYAQKLRVSLENEMQ